MSSYEKTTPVSHPIEGLAEEYVVSYVSLRGSFISDYMDFIKVLFKSRGKNYKEVLKTISEISAETLKFSGIPVAESAMNAHFKENLTNIRDDRQYLKRYSANYIILSGIYSGDGLREDIRTNVIRGSVINTGIPGKAHSRGAYMSGVLICPAGDKENSATVDARVCCWLSTCKT